MARDIPPPIHNLHANVKRIIATHSIMLHRPFCRHHATKESPVRPAVDYWSFPKISLPLITLQSRLICVLHEDKLEEAKTEAADQDDE
ncbi:unnamed protein product [Fusarium venenatum]|uniref:Uncharacterized protein n=1 Tax=Fusarium venenatum TaxID=56646 RepID=A0A2L2TDL3_9HYPO|nr:uncharacterized protein FVRRES_02635 [Fusarium venenatum]CEI66123.1 unnamed protein product [Fusarium venenatum]